jgi:hypothetical protein
LSLFFGILLRNVSENLTFHISWYLYVDDSFNNCVHYNIFVAQKSYTPRSTTTETAY